ncbi:hypothetical protein EDC96DRAFT_525378, partial [Choanephora cucurbitarum]
MVLTIQLVFLLLFFLLLSLAVFIDKIIKGDFSLFLSLEYNSQVFVRSGSQKRQIEFSVQPFSRKLICITSCLLL